MHKATTLLSLVMMASVGWPGRAPAAAQGTTPPPSPHPPVDLSGPDYTPPDCPAWAIERLPDRIKPYAGVNGTPAEWYPKDGILAKCVRGIDRYQANNYLFYRPETAAYLYGDYTPLAVDYKPGTLPAYEKAVARHTAGCRTDSERLTALLKAMPDIFRHTLMPPCGAPSVPTDRNLDDEALLASRCGWCNEQARVFVRLCQVLGMPGRLVHLFGQNHTVCEICVDGGWAMVDASNLFVAPGRDGKWLSAAQCHDGGEGQRLYAEAKKRRMMELAAMNDEALGFPTADQAAKFREGCAKLSVDELARRNVGFGVINYPLPR